MSTGLENDLLEGDGFYGYASEEEFYEAVQNGEINFGAEMTDNYNEAMGNDSYAPRPQDYPDGGYDEALAEWYANTPLEELTRDSDRQLWAVQAYNAGDLSADEAQAMWDEAFYSRYGSAQGDSLSGSVNVSVDENGNVVHSFDDGTGFDRNTSTYNRIVFGEDDTSSYDSYVESTIQQNQQFTKGFIDGFQDMVASMSNNPAGMLILGLMTGGAASSLVASLGLSGSAAAALSGALSSAANQVLRGDDFDIGAILESAALSGLSTAALNEIADAIQDPDSFLNDLFGEMDLDNRLMGPDGTVYTMEEIDDLISQGVLNPAEVADWAVVGVDTIDGDILGSINNDDALEAVGGIIDAVTGSGDSAGGGGSGGGDTSGGGIVDTVDPVEEVEEEVEEVVDIGGDSTADDIIDDSGDEVVVDIGGDSTADDIIDDSEEDEVVVDVGGDSTADDIIDDSEEDEVVVDVGGSVVGDENVDDEEEDEVVVGIGVDEPPGLPTGSGGLLSGGSFDPEWGDLFAYTRLTPYQKEVLEPLKQQISTAKGMLS